MLLHIADPSLAGNETKVRPEDGFLVRLHPVLREAFYTV